MTNFAKTINELRLKKEWSQRKLALMSGVSNTEIGRIEKGEREKPSLTVISKLAAAFGMSIDDLLLKAGVTQSSYDAPSGKKPKKLLELIEQEDYTLNGQIATPEDKEKIARVIEALYYDAKEKNKRK